MSRRSLIERLSALEPERFSGRVYRSTSPGYDVLSGEGARAKGGRWNPPDSFPVLYTATDPSAAALEVYRTASRFGVRVVDLLPRHLTTIRVRLERVANLSSPANLTYIGLSASALLDDDLRLCQALGDAVHYLGFEAVLAPSATASAANTLAIFVNSIGATSELDILTTELLDVGGVT